MTERIKKPIKPDNDDCCGGGGCCPCVWDYYFDQLALWEAQQEALEKEALEKEKEQNDAAHRNG